MISIEKEKQTNVNESSTLVHEEYDADSEDDYTDRPAQRAIDLLNCCDNLLYDMQSYIEERSENKDCICKDCQPPPARSPLPYSCCNEIICQCNEDNYSIDTEEYNNSWERQIDGNVFSDYSEENQINIEEYITWTMCGMNRQALENIYAKNIKIKQVIAGKIKPDMNPKFLINNQWWKEPQAVQLENNINYLKYIKRLMNIYQFTNLNFQKWISNITITYIIIQLPSTLNNQQQQQIQKQSIYFIIKNNFIYKKDKKKQNNLLQVIRRHELVPVLFMFHNDPTAAHFSVDTMFDKIQSRYYWPQMYNDIRSYVMSCDSCQRRGKQKTKLPLHPIPVESPFHQIGIDFVGPLPITTNGNKYIITAMDYLTKWPEARPVKEATAEQAALFIYEEIICRHG
ncbi:10422_t:CDS:2, partial [Rhizophagus irregularis]